MEPAGKPADSGPVGSRTQSTSAATLTSMRPIVDSKVGKEMNHATGEDMRVVVIAHWQAEHSGILQEGSSVEGNDIRLSSRCNTL